MPRTAGEGEEIAKGFQQKWNYPCFIGGIDGKHIEIQQPSNSGSELYNYKHFFSILHLAMVDASCKFTYMNIGAPGRAGDAGFFNDSTLKQALVNRSLNLPEPKVLMRNSQTKVSYHIGGDDAFLMSEHL